MESEYLLSKYRVSFQGDENILELDTSPKYSKVT